MLWLFDLDGTLSDPLEGICNSLNATLAAEGRPLVSPEQAARFIGPPLEAYLPTLLGSSDAGTVKRAIHRFRERYGDTGFAENRPYAGIDASLRQLAASGVGMAICTSKPGHLAERIVDLFGWGGLFRFIDGGGGGIAKWQQLEALKQQGLVDSSSLMIGDRHHDLEGAKRNGLRAVGVTWGYGSREELRSCEPWCLLDSPHDLPGLAARLEQA